MAVLLAAALPASAVAEVVVRFQDGFVTLQARDATLRQILEEWARVGKTRLVNVHVAPAEPLTLELTRVPEKEAIAVLLRSAAGYVAAPRSGPGGPSQFAQIRLMPPSIAPPAPVQPVRRRFGVRRPPMLQPQVLVDDQGNPVPPPNPYTAEGEQGDPAIAGPMIDEDAAAGDGEQATPEPRPYPGVQPYPGQQPYTPGDPPPPEPEEPMEPPAEETPQAVRPGPVPGTGALTAPVPGQLPLPSPRERRSRR